MRAACLDHSGGRALQSQSVMAWILPSVHIRCSRSTFLPRGDALVADRHHEPSGAKIAPKAVVGRVSLYLRQLESYQRQGCTTISSSQLGEPLSIKNAQVRKDLAFFGQFGHPGIGYRIDELIEALRHILGIDHDWPLALVGLGNLGRALLKYRGFRTRGFHVVALFDNDPEKIGQSHDGLIVEPIESLRKVVALRKINLAILCVPAEVAQRVADLLVAGGIRGILNFAPVPLVVPPSVNLVAVDLSIQLENLAYKVQKTQGEVSCAG
jgi:redox-sensing transcriptional repressor